ncbi:MAG: PilX N-terminal domain-containing pilus assembly protein [Candidatus Omnitrophota bacterium]
MKKSYFYPWRNRGSVLIVGLWILVILTILAVITGGRLSSELRFVRSQRDRLKALYLARAGINQAIAELEKDTTKDIDYSTEPWTDNPEIFKEHPLGSGKFSVSYNFTTDDKEETFYGVIDEERRINLNIADKYILSCLSELADDLIDNIRAWRGDTDVPESARDYSELGYSCKGKPFVNTEELLLVKGITPEIYEGIKDLVTVWAKAVNINTASKEVINIIVSASGNELRDKGQDIPEAEEDSLVQKIMDFREKDSIFEDVNLENKLEDLSSAQKNLINNLTTDICVDSNYFRIISVGELADSGLKYKVNSVLDFKNRKFLYWNES